MNRTMPRAVDIQAALAPLPVLRNRRPDTPSAEAAAAFARLAETRDGAVFAGMRADAGDDAIMLDAQLAEGPAMRFDLGDRARHVGAGQAETCGGLAEQFGIELRFGKGRVADAIDRCDRFFRIGEDVGGAARRFGQQAPGRISEPRTAIGPAAINAKIISRHERLLRGGGIAAEASRSRGPRLGGDFGADHNAKAAKTKVAWARKASAGAVLPPGRNGRGTGLVSPGAK